MMSIRTFYAGFTLHITVSLALGVSVLAPLRAATSTPPPPNPVGIWYEESISVGKETVKCPGRIFTESRANEQDAEECGETIAEFKPDGSVVVTTKEQEGDFTLRGRWTYSDNRLTIRYRAGGESLTETGKIEGDRMTFDPNESSVVARFVRARSVEDAKAGIKGQKPPTSTPAKSSATASPQPTPPRVSRPGLPSPPRVSLPGATPSPSDDPLKKLMDELGKADVTVGMIPYDYEFADLLEALNQQIAIHKELVAASAVSETARKRKLRDPNWQRRMKAVLARMKKESAEVVAFKSLPASALHFRDKARVIDKEVKTFVHFYLQYLATDSVKVLKSVVESNHRLDRLTSSFVAERRRM